MVFQSRCHIAANLFLELAWYVRRTVPVYMCEYSIPGLPSGRNEPGDSRLVSCFRPVTRNHNLFFLMGPPTEPSKSWISLPADGPATPRATKAESTLAPTKAEFTYPKNRSPW